MVDLIVFDDQACARVRQEALAFLMDHTEGFDDEPEDAEGQLDLSLASITGFESVGGGVSSKKGGKKAVVSKSDQARALARRQRTAQQLETLTEFAEHHLGCRVDWAPRLAEACLGLRKYSKFVADLFLISQHTYFSFFFCIFLCLYPDMLYNWSTTIALLLRESDELITSALRPIQSSILLRMFVHCAVDLTQRRAKFSTSSGSLSSADRQFRESWESLNENLQMYLPALLTRFKDDEENLIVLVELLSCCEYSEERPLKALLKVLLELFDLTRQERILSGMATCLAGWLRTGGTIAGTVEGAVRRLLQACWQTILDLTAQLQGIVARREGADSGSEVASAKKGAKRKSKTTTSQVL